LKEIVLVSSIKNALKRTDMLLVVLQTNLEFRERKSKTIMI